MIASTAEKLAGGDHDGVGPGLHLDDIARFATGCGLTEPQAAALPDRERVGAPVVPHRRAVGIDDVAGLLAEAVGQPLAGVAVGDEADVVAVGLVRDVEPARCRLLADLWLGRVTQGEERPRQLVLVEHTQDVGLVLAHVDGAMQLPCARGTFDDLGVVAGRHGIEPQRHGLVEQSGELDLLVAAQARVGRATRGVLGDEVLDHVALEPRGHVPDIEGDPDHVGHPAGVTGVLDGATADALSRKVAAFWLSAR